MSRDNISHRPLIDLLKAELQKNAKMTSTDAVRLARANHYNEDEPTIQTIFVGIKTEAKMELISKIGSSLVRGNNESIGAISVEPTGARFNPAPGESFTYRELQQIADFVKDSNTANDGTK